MSKTKRVAFNTLVQLIARAVTTAISLVAIGLIGRYLGVEGYGQFTLIFSYLSLVGVLVDFGFFLLQVRELAKHPEKEAEILGNIFGLKLFLSLIVFSLGVLASVFIYHNPLIVTGILIGSLSQTALTLHQVPASYFQANLQMQVIATLNIVARALYIVLVWLAIHYDLGLLGLVWAIVAINIFIFLLQWIVISRRFILRPRWDTAYWKHFIKEAMPLGVVVVVSMIYFRLDSVLLSILKDAYAVGIYGPPYKVIEVLLTVPTIFMSSVFPLLTQALKDDFGEAQRMFRKAFDFTSLVALPLGFGVMSIATPAMILMVGPAFAASGSVLAIIGWAAVISFFGAVFNYAVIASGLQRILVWPYLAATIFNIVANLFVIPRYSYIGASYVMVATELLVISWVIWLTWKRCHLSPHLNVFFRALIAAIIMWVGIRYVFHFDSVFINAGLGAVIYALVALAIGAVPKELIRKLLAR